MRAILFALGLIPFGAVSDPWVPVDGGSLLDFTEFTINASDADQTEPHVSDDLVAYWDRAGNRIHYYRFSSGNDTAVATPSGASDYLSDVSGTLIAFSRFEGSGRQPIMVFDTASNQEIEVAPEDYPYRVGTAIGGTTVAFVDFDAASEGEIFVARPYSNSAVRLTNDARLDRRPNVAPAGDRVVWESCSTTPTSCDVYQAYHSGTSWAVNAVEVGPGDDQNPDTDGTVVAYDSRREVGSGQYETDIFWRPAGGGGEQQLSIPGVQRNPSVHAGLISFENVAVGGSYADVDVYVYRILDNRLFRITQPDGVMEFLNDLTVLPGGDIRLTWARLASPGNGDIYAASFRLPPPRTGYQFGGFQAPVDAWPVTNSMKAGAAVPVKFSLGGDRGLEIFAAGSPSSRPVSCDANAPTDPVEQTVSAGGSSLAYDAATDTYTYVWKTERGWAGTCRQLDLAFADGTSAQAKFSLK